MPTTTWKESIAADEDERFLRYADQLRALQKTQATKRAERQATRASGKSGGRGGKSPNNHREAQTLRALHAKGHAGLHAELEVMDDLPEHARHGLFARPKKYAAYARFSNGSPAVQHDKKGDVRGLALKVLGVEGKKVIPGLEDATTQDFLLIHSSATPFKTPDEFMAFVLAAASPATLLFRLLGSVGIRRGLQILKRLASGGPSQPVATLAGTSFYSALPIRIGPYAARYALTPLQASNEQPTTMSASLSPGSPNPPSRNYLREDLVKRINAAPLAWDMKLQFFEDETSTPIEDASIDWTTPYVTVARLTLPKQDVESADGKKTTSLVESLSLDPWHALEAHKPLGAMMRARKHAYYASIQERKAAPEP